MPRPWIGLSQKSKGSKNYHWRPPYFYGVLECGLFCSWGRFFIALRCHGNGVANVSRSIYLRDQAAKCEWHAKNIGDSQTQLDLRKLAGEYIEQAAEIGAKEKDAGPSLWFNGRDIAKLPSPNLLSAPNAEPVSLETVPVDEAILGAPSL
jgi:hypothetical protein